HWWGSESGGHVIRTWGKGWRNVKPVRRASAWCSANLFCRSTVRPQNVGKGLAQREASTSSECRCSADLFCRSAVRPQDVGKGLAQRAASTSSECLVQRGHVL